MTVEQVVYEHLSELEGFEAVGFLSVPEGSKLPRLVVWQISDPSNKIFFATYGGQARLQIEAHTAERFQVPQLRQAIVDSVREIRGRYDDIRINAVVIANEMTRGLTTDEVYSGIVDVIVSWERINGN